MPHRPNPSIIILVVNSSGYYQIRQKWRENQKKKGRKRISSNPDILEAQTWETYELKDS